MKSVANTFNNGFLIDFHRFVVAARVHLKTFVLVTLCEQGLAETRF